MTSTNIDLNYNWLKSCDYGGEGPRGADDAHEVHVVYLAVRPCNPSPNSLFAAGLSEDQPVLLPKLPYEYDPNVPIREPPEAPR